MQQILQHILDEDLSKEFSVVKPVGYTIFIVFILALLSPIIVYLFCIVLLYLIDVLRFLQEKTLKNLLLQTKILSLVIGITKNKVLEYLENILAARVLICISLTVLVTNAVVLVYALLSRSFTPLVLIKDASIIWASNIILFGVLYWAIDSKGPNKRKLNLAPFTPDNFTFPEINLAKENWKPNLFDYLYLSFNISTSFSITDHSAVTRGSKACVIIQSLISFISVGVCFARAINILTV